MVRFKVLAVLLLVSTSAIAADYQFIVKGGKYYLINQADPTQPNKEVTVQFTHLDAVVPVPVPTPTPVPVPLGELSAVVKTATAAVPAYSDKDTHRRAMAFGMTFLSQATKDAPVKNSRDTVRQFCNVACGKDAANWNAWWATVDAKLDSLSLTPATYTVALKEIAVAIAADLPPGSRDSPKDYNGTPTFGLSPELINFLITVLLPLLLKLLGLAALGSVPFLV